MMASMTTRARPPLRLPAKLAYTTLSLVAAGALACSSHGGGSIPDAQSDGDCANAVGCEPISLDGGSCPVFVCNGVCPEGCEPLVV